jgi:methylglutamate dehydrogenase subunit C
MWPKSFWEKVYEPIIRRAAGLGRRPTSPIPTATRRPMLHCDVLVIGSGPAGLMAALAAGRAGARVILCRRGRAARRLAAARARRDRRKTGLAWAIADRPNSVDARRALMPRTTVFGWYDGNVFGALERVNEHVASPAGTASRASATGRSWRSARCWRRAAIERPLVFGGNDRPGVMTASAVRTYVNRYGVSPGRSGVVFTNNDSGYRTARDLAAAGIEVRAIVDSRDRPPALDGGGAAVLRAPVVADVKGGKAGRRGRGRRRGRNAAPGLRFPGHVGRLEPGGASRLPSRRQAGVGRQARLLPAARDRPGAARRRRRGRPFLLERLPEGRRRDGRQGGGRLRLQGQGAGIPKVATSPLRHHAAVVGEGQSKGKAFVDLQNDVTAKDVPLAAREGYSDVEQTKRYTTLGMATDQGKLSQRQRPRHPRRGDRPVIAEVGTTTFRPFYTPVAIGAFAGPSSRQAISSPCARRRCTTGRRNRARCSSRPAVVPRPVVPATRRDRLAESVTREVSRCASGSASATSPPSARSTSRARRGEFLDRLYCNTFSTLPVGKARYGLMLREDGIVFDDGTTRGWPRTISS